MLFTEIIIVYFVLWSVNGISSQYCEQHIVMSLVTGAPLLDKDV
jgi:hypothetical protein